MSRVQAQKIAKEYANALRERGFLFSRVYLFGSQATGNAKLNSDIDVAVISDKLKLNWNENEDLLWRYSLGVHPKIEPLGFTREDFRNNADPIVHEIKTTGIRVA